MSATAVTIYVDVFSRDRRCVDIVDQQMTYLANATGWQLYMNTASQSTGGRWTTVLGDYLESKLDSDYIFLWFDDLSIVELEKFGSLVKSAIAKLDIGSFDYIRFTGRPPANGELVSAGFRRIADNESYQCSLVGSVWKVGYLKRFLASSDSPWEIEKARHTGLACGAVATTTIKNFYIKGRKNIWHYPGNFSDYSWADIKTSIRWAGKRLVRVLLLRFPSIYHMLYAR